MKFLSTCLSLLFLTSFYGQRTEVIELKKGELHRGTIYFLSLDTVKIQTLDNQNLAFHREEVQALSTKLRLSLPMKNKGLFHQMEFGLLGGSYPQQGNRISAEINGTVGYQLNERWQFGLVSGLRTINRSTLIPLLSSIKYRKVSKDYALFMELRAGANINTERNNNYYWWGYQNYKNGFNTSLSLGSEFPMGKHSSFTYRMGFDFTYIESTNGYQESITRNYWYRIGAGIGILLK